MMSDTPTNGGGLTSGQRFDRLEAALIRIEDRVNASATADSVEKLDEKITDVLIHGTPTAQSAITRVALVEHDVADLKTAQAEVRAGDAAVMRAESRRRNLVTTGIGLLSGASSVAWVLSLVGALHS